MIRLTNEQWERIRNHFPEEHILDGRPGRKPIPTRCVFEAVLWILNSGAVRKVIRTTNPFIGTFKPGAAMKFCGECCRGGEAARSEARTGRFGAAASQYPGKSFLNSRSEMCRVRRAPVSDAQAWHLLVQTPSGRAY
jgi:hypothetical protein